MRNPTPKITLFKKERTPGNGITTYTLIVDIPACQVVIDSLEEAMNIMKKELHSIVDKLSLHEIRQPIDTSVDSAE